MSNASMTPGSRPRRGVIGVLALVGVGALATVVAVGVGEATSPRSVAAAVELETFGSCDELAAWGAGALGVGDEDSVTTFDAVAGEVAEAPAASGAARQEAGDDTAAADVATEGADGAAVADGTNVAVEGVDELDLVDRLAEDVVLVTGAGALAVVDLAAGEAVARMTVPFDAQVTYDAEAGVAWVVGSGAAGGVVVERYAATAEGLEQEGAWSTSGWLVDARRVGDELHVVAADGFGPPVAADGDGSPSPADEAAVPFADGPVACDAVLHPEGPADPTATLIVTLPATGEVAPVRASEVVGSGQLVHVTTDAVYLATPQWGEGGTTTGIHRFDLATLEPTGSGTVEGSLLDEFSMSAAGDVLRVATTRDGGCCVGRPIPVDGGPVPMEGDVDVASDAVAVPAPPPTEGEALNEIVVLDTDGALDEVGRTAPFGKPGETLHGIRFAGSTAYAVTFLQTDPFYVVDLSDPSAPTVVGEVELPGFSSYLHPLDDGLVVGFGPGADGRASAKLFDVADPTAPTVVGDLALGDESAVAFDHHAYVDLGDGRFAVPTTSYGVASAPPPPAADPQGEVGRGIEAPTLTSAVVVVDTAGGRLTVEERLEVATGEPAQRVLPSTGGWALLGFETVTLLDASGAVRGTVSLAG